MESLLLIAVPFLIIAVLLAVSRSARTRRHAGSTTEELAVDGNSIRRRMTDGREEWVHVPALRQVEVVCTRVKTADGADAFLLLGESDERGCLVPLGVGLDDEAMVKLSTLPGFDLRTLSEAASRRPPCRQVIWTAPAPEGPESTSS